MALRKCDRCGVEANVLWEHRILGKLYSCTHCANMLNGQLSKAGWLRYPMLPPLSADPATH